MSHRKFCYHLINCITEANGSEVVERFWVVAFRNEGDQGSIEIIRDYSKVENLKNLSFNQGTHNGPKPLEEFSMKSV